MRNISFFTAAATFIATGAMADEPVSDIYPLETPMEVLVPCVQKELPYFVGGGLTEDRVGLIAAESNDRGALVRIRGEQAESDIGYVTQVETQLLNQPPFDLEGITQIFNSVEEAEIALDEAFGGYTAQALSDYLKICSPAVLAPSA